MPISPRWTRFESFGTSHGVSRRNVVGWALAVGTSAGIRFGGSHSRDASARLSPTEGTVPIPISQRDQTPEVEEPTSGLDQLFFREHQPDGAHPPDMAGMVDARKGSRPIITNVHQDYSQTLQDLIDEAATAWHSGEAPSRILLPNGFIPLSSTIRLRDGIELKGQGSILNNGTRFLWQGDPEVPVFESNPDNYLSTCRVEDIGIQPDTALGVPPPTGQGHGFVLHAPVNTCAFRRISIARLTGNAIDIRRQSHHPDDRTGAGNCIFEQMFAITNGGFGVRAEGYHQVHFLMPDFNGNRLGDFHFLNGSGNQSAILISNLWAESGGQSPSADQRILLEHLDGGQVTLVSPQFSGPIGLETIIRVIGPSGASVNLIGASQFGSSNWVIDSVNNLTISASDRINLIGEELVARDIRVRRSISVASSEAATTAQNIVRKLEIFDGNGASLGFVPIYDQID